ncbi:hypothetical protein COE51_22760 [Bacillus pseudomycoides]|nr:hypothetical protein COE51_22760 [Bacillus pseudomycoides]
MFILSISFLSGCQNETNLKNTSLDSVSINNIRIYDDINDLDLSSYIKSDRFSYKNTKYQYENMVLDVNKEQLITYLFGFFSENEVIINGQSGLKDINSVTKLLGNNFKESWEDREQRLKYHSYYDKNNKIILKIVYSDVSKELVWVEISSNKF